MLCKTFHRPIFALIAYNEIQTIINYLVACHFKWEFGLIFAKIDSRKVPET